MISSTVPTVRAQLVTRLAARAGLAGVQVSQYHPGDQVQPEAIFTGKVTGRHDISSIKAGRKNRDETYDLDVVVSVLGSTDGKLETAETRAFALLAEIEGELADDPRIGLAPTVVNWCKAGDFEESATRTDQGPLFEIKMAMEVVARLT